MLELKEKLLSSYIAFEESVDLSDSFHKIRTDALKVFEKKGFPTRKDESWKYTSLNSIVKEDYALFPKSEKTIELRQVKKYFLYDTDTYKVIFIDGVYSPFLSDTTHDGLDVCLMSAALSKPKFRNLIKNYFNKSVYKEDSLSALNTSYALEGAFIYVPKNVFAEKPI